MSKFKDNIPGFPGYHVTKNGDVYSMKCKSGKRPEAFKLKPRLNGNGYYRIGLYNDGIKYERRLNRLVAIDLVGQFFLRKAGEGKPSIMRNVM